VKKGETNMMSLLKTAAVGAGIAFATSYVSQMDFIVKGSPTVSKYGPYAVAGGLLVAAKKFGLV
jgi:hypothetical protein